MSSEITSEERYLINQVHTCYACGNTGVLRFIDKTRWENGQFDYDGRGQVVGYYLFESQNWYIFECPVCHSPILLSQYTFDAVDEAAPCEIAFPGVPISSEGVPADIYASYEAAVKVKSTDREVCLLSVRRVLEMICRDKGAIDGTLEAMLRDLVSKKVISGTLSDALWIVRKLGNSAAHERLGRVGEFDVKQVLGFMATVIDYLYSMPFRVEKMKQKLMK